MDIIELAHEFGMATAMDGQGDMDTDTGPSTREVLQAVRDHAEGQQDVPDGMILHAWSIGYLSGKGLEL